MVLDDVYFYGRKSVCLLRICKRKRRMAESVEMQASLMIVPVVQIVIMEKSTAYKRMLVNVPMKRRCKLKAYKCHVAAMIIRCGRSMLNIVFVFKDSRSNVHAC